MAKQFTYNSTLICHAIENRVIEIVPDWQLEAREYVEAMLTGYDCPVFAIRANENGGVLESEFFTFDDQREKGHFLKPVQ